MTNIAQIDRLRLTMTTGKALCTQAVTPIYVERGFEMSAPHGTNVA